MNFTREPIIESIISARDGCKLSIRSTKVSNTQEILVDAVEIVSFGSSLFFRSQEKPKAFLYPVCDFEVSEVKETRFVLKNSPLEKSVKIQSTKEHLHKAVREAQEIEEFEEEQILEPSLEESVEEPQIATVREEKKSKRNRRKRDRQKQQRFTPVEESQEEASTEEDKGGDNKDEATVSSPTSVQPKFISPPPALIISTLAHRKSETVHQESVLPSASIEAAENALQEITMEPVPATLVHAKEDKVLHDVEISSLETPRDV